MVRHKVGVPVPVEVRDGKLAREFVAERLRLHGGGHRAIGRKLEKPNVLTLDVAERRFEVSFAIELREDRYRACATSGKRPLGERSAGPAAMVLNAPAIARAARPARAASAPTASARAAAPIRGGRAKPDRVEPGHRLASGGREQQPPEEGEPLRTRTS